MSIPRPGAFLGAVALVLMAAACAPAYGDPFLVSMATASRAHGAGRYEEAARGYAEAADKAERLKDRDEAWFLQARMMERAGRFSEAAAIYRRLVTESPDGPRSVRATFEIADLEIAHGDAERGHALLLAALRKHPDGGLARHALKRLALRASDKGGDPAALAWLRGMAPSLRRTEVEQTVDYEIAASLERLERLPEARDAYVATARAHPYPSGGLSDDAFFRAAEIEERLGRHAEAVALHRELLSARESPSQTVGSYERPRFSQAQMRIAEITRDGLHDPAAARREFHKVYEVHTTSIARDDALWAEAQLAKGAGDASDACRVITTLVEQLPESRYARCAREICPSAPLPKDAKECPGYLKEQQPPVPPGREQP